MTTSLASAESGKITFKTVAIGNLTGIVLDWSIAVSEGTFDRLAPLHEFKRQHEAGSHQYSAGLDGDKIIDREKIDTRWRGMKTQRWEARLSSPAIRTGTLHEMQALIRRDAAMRCWLTSKIGSHMEVPKLLLLNE